MPRRDGAERVLKFIGPAVRGAPARDLTRTDIARIAYRQAFALTAADGIRPPKPSPNDIRRTTTALVARGRYVRLNKKES